MTQPLAGPRILIPAIVFITVGGLFAGLWKLVNDHARAEFDLRTTLTAAQIADSIEEKVNVCLRVVAPLREDIDTGMVSGEAEFEARANSILRSFPGIASIDRLDESGLIMWTVPRNVPAWLRPPRAQHGHGGLGDQGSGANEEEFRYTPPLRLGGDKVGIVADLNLRNAPGGSISVSLVASGLINDVLSQNLRSRFRCVVYDDGTPILDSANDTAVPDSLLIRSPPIRVASRLWVVALAPNPDALPGELGWGWLLFLLLGLLAAAGMALVSSRLITSQQTLRDGEERLRAIAEHIPGVVYSYETSPGKPRSLVYLGPGLDGLVGPETAKRVEQDFDSLFALIHPDDRARLSAAAVQGAANGQTVDCEARLLTDDGSYRWIRSLSRPLLVDRDRTRWHIVLIDLKEHRHTVDALRESEQRYRALVESSPVGVLLHSGGVFEFINPAALRLLGYDHADELIGREIFVVIPEAAHDVVRERLRTSERDARSSHYGDEQLLRRDGSAIDVDIIACTIDVGGRSVRQTLVLDTSTQRQTERRQRLLMLELDHRVKNNLASVLALLDQTAASTSDFDEFRTKFANRIKAMARTHEILARSKWTGAELADITRLSVAPHIVDESNRVRIEGSSLLVCPRAALPIGLALHELATNALKYGSLSTPRGRVEIHCSRDNGHIVLRWAERGGPPAQQPAEFGTGLRLVRGLVEFELGGAASFDFDQHGLVCTLRIDADTLTERP